MVVDGPPRAGRRRRRRRHRRPCRRRGERGRSVRPAGSPAWWSCPCPRRSRTGVSLPLNGRPLHGQNTAQLPHSLHMPSTWTTWCWARPGTVMETLARLGQTSQQASQTLAQPSSGCARAGRPGRPCAQQSDSTPRWPRRRRWKSSRACRGPRLGRRRWPPRSGRDHGGSRLRPRRPRRRSRSQRDGHGGRSRRLAVHRPALDALAHGAHHGWPGRDLEGLAGGHGALTAGIPSGSPSPDVAGELPVRHASLGRAARRTRRRLPAPPAAPPRRRACSACAAVDDAHVLRRPAGAWPRARRPWRCCRRPR